MKLMKYNFLKCDVGGTFCYSGKKNCFHLWAKSERSKYYCGTAAGLIENYDDVYENMKGSQAANIIQPFVLRVISFW